MEWQLPTPVPVHNFDRIPTFDSEPYDYGDSAGAAAAPSSGGRDRIDGAIPRAEVNDTVDTTSDPFAEPPEVQERNLWLGARVMAGMTIMFFSRSCSPTSTCARSTTVGGGDPPASIRRRRTAT